MSLTATIYTKPDCQPCEWTKRKMTAEGVPYVVDSLLKEDNLAAAIELGHMSAPVVVYGTENWSGYQPDRIIAAGKRAKETA